MKYELESIGSDEPKLNFDTIHFSWNDSISVAYENILYERILGLHTYGPRGALPN